MARYLFETYMPKTIGSERYTFTTYFTAYGTATAGAIITIEIDFSTKSSLQISYTTESEIDIDYDAYSTINLAVNILSDIENIEVS